MTNLLLDLIKKQTTSFLHEKYNIARMTFTDVTPAEVLAEEATNNDPCSPDAKTMTRIAMASFNVHNSWRIAEVLRRRFYSFDWKQWRQSYKALVLLEFLLAHGPDDLAREYRCDTEIIQELSTFTYIDKNGFDWGILMKRRSERVLELLKGGDILKQERLHALKITKQIQGFGSTGVSPSSSSSPSPSSRGSNCSSFGSFSTTSSTWNEADDLSKIEFLKEKIPAKVKSENLWDPYAAIEEKDSLLNHEDGEEAEEGEGLLSYDDNDSNEYEYEESNQYGDQRMSGFLGGIRSKFGNVSPLGRSDHSERVGFRCLSAADRAKVKRIEQLSSKY